MVWWALKPAWWWFLSCSSLERSFVPCSHSRFRTWLELTPSFPSSSCGLFLRNSLGTRWLLGQHWKMELVTQVMIVRLPWIVLWERAVTWPRMIVVYLKLQMHGMFLILGTPKKCVTVPVSWYLRLISISWFSAFLRVFHLGDPSSTFLRSFYLFWSSLTCSWLSMLLLSSALEP